MTRVRGVCDMLCLRAQHASRSVPPRSRSSIRFPPPIPPASIGIPSLPRPGRSRPSPLQGHSDSVVGAPREKRHPNPSRVPSAEAETGGAPEADAASRNRRHTGPSCAAQAAGPPPVLPPAVSAPATAGAGGVEPPARCPAARSISPYAALQRGHYQTAFTIATGARRAARRRQGDGAARRALRRRLRRACRTTTRPPSGTGRAAERGDREAMFALAMMRMVGRAGAVNREEAAKLLAAAARLKHPIASYNLAHALSRRPAVPARLRARRANCSASPPKPAARRRNTRSPRSTRKAAA